MARIDNVAMFRGKQAGGMIYAPKSSLIANWHKRTLRTRFHLNSTRLFLFPRVNSPFTCQDQCATSNRPNIPNTRQDARDLLGVPLYIILPFALCIFHVCPFDFYCV